MTVKEEDTKENGEESLKDKGIFTLWAIEVYGDDNITGLFIRLLIVIKV